MKTRGGIRSGGRWISFFTIAAVIWFEGGIDGLERHLELCSGSGWG